MRKIGVFTFDKKDSLYNVIFPLWAIFFMTPLILIPLIGNLIIDGMVISITLRLIKTHLPWKRLREIILKAWGIGFGSDLVGFAVLLTITGFTRINEFNPFVDGRTLFAYLFAICVSGISIFGFNYKILRREGLGKKSSIIVSLAMGITTAPWMFLIPTDISKYVG